MKTIENGCIKGDDWLKLKPTPHYLDLLELVASGELVLISDESGNQCEADYKREWIIKRNRN
jgi:hypothetical protein